MKINLATTKTYRRHNCGRKHRTYRTLAKCIWPRAAWITGNGPYASLAKCGVLTVWLFPDLASAESAKRIIDNSGCGHACPCTGRGHEIVLLARPEECEEW